jgi:hypothetical protein
VQPLTPITNAQVQVNDPWQGVTRAWIIWAQGVFASLPLGRYRWTEDPETSEILVAGQEPEVNGMQRPRVIVSRGPIGFSGLSINQMESQSLMDTSRSTSDLMSSTIIITVGAREGAEAQWLAYLLFRLVIPFKGELQRAAKLHAILTGRMQMSQEDDYSRFMPGSPSGDFRGVQLSVPVYMQDRLLVDSEQFFGKIRHFIMTATTK